MIENGSFLKWNQGCSSPAHGKRYRIPQTEDAGRSGRIDGASQLEKDLQHRRLGVKASGPTQPDGGYLAVLRGLTAKKRGNLSPAMRIPPGDARFQARRLFTKFHPAERTWFEAVFPAPTRPQILGWAAIARGSGKTLSPDQRKGVPGRSSSSAGCSPINTIWDFAGPSPHTYTTRIRRTVERPPSVLEESFSAARIQRRQVAPAGSSFTRPCAVLFAVLLWSILHRPPKSSGSSSEPPSGRSRALAEASPAPL